MLKQCAWNIQAAVDHLYIFFMGKQGIFSNSNTHGVCWLCSAFANHCYSTCTLDLNLLGSVVNYCVFVTMFGISEHPAVCLGLNSGTTRNPWLTSTILKFCPVKISVESSGKKIWLYPWEPEDLITLLYESSPVSECTNIVAILQLRLKTKA